MKNTALFLALVSCFYTVGQVPNNNKKPLKADDCAKYKSLYYEYLKQGQLADARHFWLKAEQDCGGLKAQDEGFFINGTIIYKGLRKGVAETDTVLKKQLNDSIALIYKTDWKVHKNPRRALEYANHLYYYLPTENTELDQLFQNIHQLKGETPALYIETYFKHLLFNKFNQATASEREKITTSILKNYFLLRDYCALGIENSRAIKDPASRQKYVASYEDATVFLDKALIKVPFSETVINELFLVAYQNYTNEKTERLKIIEHDVELLAKLNATDLLIYKELVYESLTLAPTATGYLAVGNIELNDQKNEKAAQAYQQALGLNPTAAQTGEIYYKLSIAQYQQRNYKEAFVTAKKVTGSLKGKALKLAGDCIVALADNCGDSSFERKANYWLANDYYTKAIANGEDVSSSIFSSLWPTQQQCFEENIVKGTNYRLTCWGETTVVR